VFYIFLASLLAAAHTGGHGPKVMGHQNCAVINAKDAELGEHAKLVTIAHWEKGKDELIVSLKDAKTGPGEIKWILLGTNKPRVHVTRLISADQKVKTSLDLTGIKSVEVILPTLGDVNQKHVLSFTL
jgi:hypothetical protein